MITARSLSRLLIALVTISVVAILTPALLSAKNIPDITTSTGPTAMGRTTTPVYSNGSVLINPPAGYPLETDLIVAQSLKAVTIDREAAIRSTEEAEKAIGKLDKATADLAAKERALASLAADHHATDEEIAAAERRVADARALVEVAERAADSAAADALETDVNTVQSMRDAGLSWGEICQAIGVSPSALGSAVDVKSEKGLIGKALDSLFGSLGTASNSKSGTADKGKGNKGSGGHGGGGGNSGGGGHGGGGGHDGGGGKK